MQVNISLLVLKKMYDILMIFVEIFHDFGLFFATRIQIRFIRNTAWMAVNKTDFCRLLIGKPQKKVIFLIARPLRPLAPTPLSGHRNFFPYIKKKFFFLSGTPF